MCFGGGQIGVVILLDGENITGMGDIYPHTADGDIGHIHAADVAAIGSDGGATENQFFADAILQPANCQRNVVEPIRSFDDGDGIGIVVQAHRGAVGAGDGIVEGSGVGRIEVDDGDGSVADGQFAAGGIGCGIACRIGNRCGHGIDPVETTADRGRQCVSGRNIERPVRAGEAQVSVACGVGDAVDGNSQRLAGADGCAAGDTGSGIGSGLARHCRSCWRRDIDDDGLGGGGAADGLQGIGAGCQRGARVVISPHTTAVGGYGGAETACTAQGEGDAGIGRGRAGEDQGLVAGDEIAEDAAVGADAVDGYGAGLVVDSRSGVAVAVAGIVNIGSRSGDGAVNHAA